MHFSPDQRVCRVPDLRGRHDPVRLVAAERKCGDVWDLLYRFTDDVQVVGRAVAHKPRCAVRRAVRAQSRVHRRIRLHAVLPRPAHTTGPLAALPHHVRHSRLRRGTGHFVSVQLAYLPEDRALRRWAVLRDLGKSVRRYDDI